jgi:hypothetical protein
MDIDKEIEPVFTTYNQESISFPLNENAFREFVVSLLGQPESVEGYIEGPFEIDMGSFEHLDHIIDDRIAKQNQSSLLEFKAKLFFHDESSMSFNGVQSFTSYRESRPLICEGFTFTWSYLVKFNNKTTFEKQEILILSLNNEDSSSDSESDQGLIPRISYSIRCTDKGWGVEIAELTQNCLSSFIKINHSSTINKLRKTIIENITLVKYSLTLLIFAIFSWYISQSSGSNFKECENLGLQVDNFLKSSPLVDKKLDFITKLVSSCTKSTPTSPFLLFFITLAPAVTVVLGPSLICRLVQFPSYRFILFTEASKRQRDQYFHTVRDRKKIWIASGLGSLTLSVLGNYIFKFLSSIFHW